MARRLGRRATGRFALLVAAGLLAAAGCGGSDGGDGRAADEARPPATSAPPSAEPADPSGNPVLDEDFPDPDVVEVDGVLYAYATNTAVRNVQVALLDGPSLAEGAADAELQPVDALPALPSWVIRGKTWAPEVTRLGDDSFVMYATTTNYQPTLQCIAAATSTSPEGPFEVAGEEMLVCPEDEGGAIDAATFLDDDGTLYLLWKNDGNCCGYDTWIYVAPLSADGLSLAGEPTRLITQDQPWEGNLVEAPTLVKRDGTYVLLYSANDYGGPQYAIGYATADSVTGPYTKAEGPLLTTDLTEGRYIGPGGQDVVETEDGDVLLFHSWYAAETYRALNALPLEWEDGTPVVTLEE